MYSREFKLCQIDSVNRMGLNQNPITASYLEKETPDIQKQMGTFKNIPSVNEESKVNWKIFWV